MSVLVAGLLGCDGDVEQVTDRNGSSGNVCSVWRCGFTAPEVNGRSLQELSLAGVANLNGVRIVGFVAPSRVPLGGYTLAVEGDELVARRGASKLSRKQLVGSIIRVQPPDSLAVSVTIAGYQSVPSWADGGDPIAAYTLVYPEPSALLGVKNVCSGSLLDPLAAAVTVLGGETYDAATKTVHAAPGWFTLAVAAGPLQEVDAWLDRFRHFWDRRLDALATELACGKRERRGS